jgi:hypothetical protein
LRAWHVPEDIAELRSALTLPWPASFLESLAICGAFGDPLCSQMHSDIELFSAKQMLQNRADAHIAAAKAGILYELDDPDGWAINSEETWFVYGPVKPRQYNALWLDIGRLAGEDLFLDFDPAPGGRIAQVIRVDRVNNDWCVIENTFEAFLTLLHTKVLTAVATYSKQVAASSANHLRSKPTFSLDFDLEAHQQDAQRIYRWGQVARGVSPLRQHQVTTQLHRNIEVRVGLGTMMGMVIFIGDEIQATATPSLTEGYNLLLGGGGRYDVVVVEHEADVDPLIQATQTVLAVTLTS